MKRLKFLILTILFAFLANSCNNPFNSDLSPSGKPPAGKGSFSLKIAGEGRTIMPKDKAFANENLVYKLIFTPTGANGTLKNVNRAYNNLEETVVLDLGTYNLVVNAYDAKDNLLFTGSADNIDITEDVPATAEVTLQPVTGGGTGTFSWDIILPPGIVSASMAITNRGTNTPATDPIPLYPATAITTQELPSGFYNVIITMTGRNSQTGANITATRKEILHIYNGYDSPYEKDFSDVKFVVYNVTFRKNAGEAATKEVTHGDTISDYFSENNLASYKPTSNAYLYEGAAPANNAVGYTFDGWFLDPALTEAWDDAAPVTEDIELHPKWIGPVNVSGNTSTNNFNSIVTYLNGITPAAAVSYTLFIADDVTLPTLSLTVKNRVTLTVKSVDTTTPSTILRGSEDGDNDKGLFMVPSGANLVFENIVIDGKYKTDGVVNTAFENNLASLVRVDGGAFTLGNGAVLKNNRAGEGGGVFVDQKGEFTMRGTAAIIGNTTDSGGGGVCVCGGVYTGGVYVDGGTFNMEGGEINNNKAGGNGGGVYISSSTFTMSDGIIGSDDNNTEGNTSSFNGGGVYLDGGTFSMEGGKIKYNKTTRRNGGGVYVGDGTFTMNDGTIMFNVAEDGDGTDSFGNGAGVYVNGTGNYANGTFIMNDGAISNNETVMDGGGVYIMDGTFTMNGGAITDNKAGGSNGGGGACIEVYSAGIFTLGGTAQITGNTKNNSDNNLVLADGYITPGEPLEEPAEIWVQTFDVGGIIVDEDATPDAMRYFRTEASGKVVVFETDGINDQLVLKNGSYISSESELAGLGDALAGGSGNYYVLAKNIEITTDWATLFGDTVPFFGKLEGNGYTITFNETVVTSTDDNYGLINNIGLDDGASPPVSGAVKNLKLAGKISVSGGGTIYVGAVAGKNFGTIENVSSSVVIVVNNSTDGTNAGGIAGSNDGSILKCFTTQAITATGNVIKVGGIAGSGAIGSSVKNCYTEGDVTANGDGNNAGGVVGQNYGNVENCRATGDIKAIDDTNSGTFGNNAGGVVGHNDGDYSTVKNCYATGDVTATGNTNTSNRAGGVVGYNLSPNMVENCYAAGDVTASSSGSSTTYAGGVVGYNGGTTKSCVALNAAITLTAGNTSNIGRVVAYNYDITRLSDNYARGDMTLSSGPVTSDNTATGKNGAVFSDWDSVWSLSDKESAAESKPWWLPDSGNPKLWFED